MNHFRYRVMKFEPENGAFIIRYYFEEPDDGYEVNIPLPIKADKSGYLSGKELIDHIRAYGPQDTSEMERLAKTLPKSHIDAMVYDPLAGKTQEEIKKIRDDQLNFEYNDRISDWLDDVVRERDYETFESLISYVNSTNETWKAEALAGMAWQDEVYAYWYDLWNDYQTNNTPLPPWEELKDTLPKIQW